MGAGLLQYESKLEAWWSLEKYPKHSLCTGGHLVAEALCNEENSPAEILADIHARVELSALLTLTESNTFLI